MVNLGYLLANRVDPQELEEARQWYLKAADAGNTQAMNNLGYLLADQLDPQELEEARRLVPEGRRRRQHPGNGQPRQLAG